MRALVVYESPFGNTHCIAEAIGRGLADTVEVDVVGVHAAPGLEGVDLLVVGGPTQVHTLSTPRARAETPERAADARRGLRLDDDAGGIGIREWLDALPPFTGMAASFDTRTDIPRILSGAAAGHLDHRLAGHGLRPVITPMSFLVDTHNDLEHTELDRARAWGALLGCTARATAAVDALSAH
ncbi:flavodoxin [Rathayibacter sp. VKM Ac-2801]|uniref:flavodoxin family protein n=1 Tax=Rathayibacter sp. VKM Ac-2801 TaxID=2609255 RepID=UPI0013202C21|nr:flavodoxin [Rathayibacter sp. VKM Ac-2801]QHC69552.1 flavodoxin [Rathayibacter sp. VKM Ac-2801]